MIAKRFGLDNCCDIDKRKYEIKKALLDLAAIKDPHLCNPICAFFTYSIVLDIGDSAITTYVNCDSVEETVIKLPATVYGNHTIDVCGLTTMTPVIVITRTDGSIEQYKLATEYKVCCPPLPESMTICSTYTGSAFFGIPEVGAVGISYLDCAGDPAFFTAPPSTGAESFEFCGRPNQVLECGGCKGLTYSETQDECSPIVCSEYTITLQTSLGAVIDYIDCTGTPVTANFPSQVSEQVVNICGIAGQVLVCTTCNSFSSVEGGYC